MAKGKQKQKEQDRKVAIQIEVDRRVQMIPEKWKEVKSVKDMQNLVSEAKADIQYLGFSAPVNQIPNEYAIKSKQLTKLIKTLEAPDKLFKLVANLQTNLNTLTPEDAILKSRVSTLTDYINKDVTQLMEKGIDGFTQDNVSECIEMIAKTIDLHRDKFEPAWWHSVADVFIKFLNGIKSIAQSLGADVSRSQLFKERAVEGVEFNRVMEQLEADAKGFEPDAAQP